MAEVHKDGLSVFELEAALFDDGIGKNFTGDTFHLGFGGGPFEAVIEGENKVLSLADVGDSAILHSAQRIRDGLPLGIQHGSFQRDIDMSLHLD